MAALNRIDRALALKLIETRRVVCMLAITVLKLEGEQLEDWQIGDLEKFVDEIIDDEDLLDEARAKLN